MKTTIAWLGSALWLNAAVGVAAVAPDARAPGSTTGVTKQLVEQKEALVKRLLTDSPAVKRVDGSGNAEAKKHLMAAQHAYAKAQSALKANTLNEADNQFNEAIWMIGKARQLVPDPATRNIEHRVRYAQMVRSVESLKATYQRHLQRGGIQPGTDPQMAKAVQLIDTAKNQSHAEQLEQANRTLGEAENILMLNIGRVLGARTIEYAQRFESITEEYGFELDRNRSYAELIPIALAEFKPGSEAIRQVNFMVENNRQMREQAQQHAAKKNYKEALTAVRGGTTHLQNALAAAGLNVPQETKIETAVRP